MANYASPQRRHAKGAASVFAVRCTDPVSTHLSTELFLLIIHQCSFFNIPSGSSKNQTWTDSLQKRWWRVEGGRPFSKITRRISSYIHTCAGVTVLPETRTFCANLLKNTFSRSRVDWLVRLVTEWRAQPTITPFLQHPSSPQHSKVVLKIRQEKPYYIADPEVDSLVS
ncbi:hypothetical protein J6590_021170 [Homalodisca vitripennis]|nr:hypothetical protein J6590_021170 [Homalodisca vitripennis]